MSILLEELDKFPGFYKIPGFKRYGITKIGTVINLTNYSILKPFQSASGYYYYSLRDDNEKHKFMARHRLVCTLFNGPSLNEKAIYVNHKDGVKGNDHHENLEWVTPKENVEHAGKLGISDKCKPTIVRDYVSGVEKYFPSIKACADFYGVSKDFINYRVKHPNQIFPEKKQYKIVREGCDWYCPENLELALLKNGRNKQILLRYVMTGEERIFLKLLDLAEFLNISPSVVTQWSKLPNQPVLPGFIQIKFLSDPTPWREVKDANKELVQNKGRIIKVECAKSGTIQIFYSAVECAKAMNLKPSCLNYRLKANDKIVFSDGYKYSYY